MKRKKILYITYDGITDHIGQSQVAPYMIGLSKKGHRITILSAEKKGKLDLIDKYKKLFAENNIEWHYTNYHYSPPVLSTIWDIWKLQQLAIKLLKKNQFQIVHCRSYVSSLIGLHLKKNYGTKFIFDMRDFWPDARKEVKSFDVDHNRIHKIIYDFFKKKEKTFLENADYIISLTEAGKKVIEKWKAGDMQVHAPIAVIPCCADFEFFDPLRLDANKLSELKDQFGLTEGDFILNYLGSLGPAYLTSEVLDFFKVLLDIKPGAKFLVVANNDHHLIKNEANKKGIDPGKLIITKGVKDDIPYFIALSDLSVFFIMPSFAKQACSPTKLAELFAMNVPVISNTKVGDLDTILDLKINGSEIVQYFDEKEYKRVLQNVLNNSRLNQISIRDNSIDQFSVKCGIESYNKVYKSL